MNRRKLLVGVGITGALVGLGYAATRLTTVEFEGNEENSGVLPGSLRDTEPGGAGIAGAASAVTHSPCVAARNALRAADARYRNEGNLPTAAQLALWSSIRHRAVPSRIVSRVRTPIPDGGPRGRNMRGFASAFRNAFGSGQYSGVLAAAVYAYETGAGFRDNASCYHHNYGNIKGNGATGDVYFLVDNVCPTPSLDFYPKFDTDTSGLASMVRLFNAAHYNKRVGSTYTFHGVHHVVPQGYIGASEALRTGNARALGQAMGIGGWATSYYTQPGLIPSLIRRMVSDGVIDAQGVNLA